MMKFLRNTLLLTVPVMLTLSPSALAFDLFGSSCNGNTSSTCQAGTPSSNPVNGTLQTVANILAVIAGVTAVIMIIISGLTMITSQGNEESIKTSRNRIIYSVVGLIIIALAWSITSFIANRL